MKTMMVCSIVAIVVRILPPIHPCITMVARSRNMPALRLWNLNQSLLQWSRQSQFVLSWT